MFLPLRVLSLIGLSARSPSSVTLRACFLPLFWPPLPPLTLVSPSMRRFPPGLVLLPPGFLQECAVSGRFYGSC